MPCPGRASTLLLVIGHKASQAKVLNFYSLELAGPFNVMSDRPFKVLPRTFAVVLLPALSSSTTGASWAWRIITQLHFPQAPASAGLPPRLRVPSVQFICGAQQ